MMYMRYRVSATLLVCEKLINLEGVVRCEIRIWGGKLF